MQRAEVDGVPVFWVDGPAPLAAVLMFRTGFRDEPFPQRGVTHLVEHLAMSRIGRRHHDHNASVSVAMTSFEAVGSGEAVAAFLADVCGALHDLPTDRLDVERKVLAVEAEDGLGILDLHLLLRYGLRGPGLAGALPPAPDALDAATVRDWAGRHFLRSTAVLALSGPPPAGLRLPLPDGPVPPRPPVAPIELGGPVWAEHPGDRGVALSVGIPTTEAAAAGARIARQRLTDELRHRLGLVYDLDLDLAGSVSTDGGTLSLVADPPARAAGQVAAALDAVLTDLRQHGPTAAELDDDLAEGGAVHDDPRSALEKAAAAAAEHLHRRRVWDPDTARAERESVTPADVRAAFEDYPATAILTVPQGVVPDLPGYRPYPEHLGSPVSGQAFRRQVFGPVPRGVRLVVGEDGVSLVGRDGSATVRWDDVVGYGAVDPDLRILYGGNGCTIDLHPLFFKDGERAMQLIDARIPAGVRFAESLPEAPPPGGRRRSRPSR